MLKDSSGLRGVEESTEGKHSISPQGVEDTPFSRKTRQNRNEEDCFAAGQQARGISQLTTPAQIGEVGIKSCSAVGGVETHNKLISFLARTRQGMKGLPDKESEE